MAKNAGVRAKESVGASGALTPCADAQGFDPLCATCARACKQQVTCVVVSCPLHRAGAPAA